MHLKGSPKACYGDWKSWELEDMPRPSKLQHCWDQPEYQEESWWLEETWCYSDFSEKLSANVDANISQWVIIIAKIEKTQRNNKCKLSEDRD